MQLGLQNTGASCYLNSFHQLLRRCNLPWQKGRTQLAKQYSEFFRKWDRESQSSLHSKLNFHLGRDVNNVGDIREILMMIFSEFNEGYDKDILDSLTFGTASTITECYLCNTCKRNTAERGPPQQYLYIDSSAPTYKKRIEQYFHSPYKLDCCENAFLCQYRTRWFEQYPEFCFLLIKNPIDDEIPNEIQFCRSPNYTLVGFSINDGFHCRAATEHNNVWTEFDDSFTKKNVHPSQYKGSRVLLYRKCV